MTLPNGVVVTGCVLIGIGSYLPWVVNSDPTSLVRYGSMTSGMYSGGLITFPLAAAALIGMFFDLRVIGNDHFGILVGGVATIISVTYLRYIYTMVFDAGAGPYVALIGGLLVLISVSGPLLRE